MKIKSIDIHAKEWVQKSTNNAYFSALVTVNKGYEDERTVKVRFQDGYDRMYIAQSMEELENAGIVTDFKHNSNGSTEPVWKYCEDREITLRTSIEKRCKKIEVEDLVK